MSLARVSIERVGLRGVVELGSLPQAVVIRAESLGVFGFVKCD
jgi:hypothetical protein